MKTIFAKSAPDWTTLLEHTKQVVMATKKIAQYAGYDECIAANGAILHDLGKAHNFFQDRLLGKANKKRIFRHEISSLFFLSIFPTEQWHKLIEMVIGHHKSVRNDGSGLGLLDLEETEDYIDFHLGKWEEWSRYIIPILNEFDISDGNIPTREQAIRNLNFTINYCEKVSRERDFSPWRGILMGGDHFASAQLSETEKKMKNLFKNANLNFYNRQSPMYPLSQIDTKSDKKHTLVVAPTGAGKTDFLLRRCKGRVFYTLPFQASINAMYKRLGHELEKENPDIDLRVLHSSSQIIKRKEDDDTSLQGLFGSSVTVLTPHQLATIVFGLKGFETVLIDTKDCDIILDEVHTYSGISQSLVIKLIEILKMNNCRIHVGTATMPSVLYNKIREILDNENVLEVALPKIKLEEFNRHIIHKIDSFDSIWNIVDSAIEKKYKILIVLNKVKTAQLVFTQIKERYPNINSLLLHSRFKRGDRNEKERSLIGVNEEGESLEYFNTGHDACIVVSTQVVEVSLDISFDVMFTQAAPLDALIQRFGRINRKRTKETIGKYKDIYVIAPPDNEKDAKPYDMKIINRSYEVLNHNNLLSESDLQEKIDSVFTELNMLSIEEHSIFKSDGSITIDKLTHSKESVLMKLLEIDSVVCITESDISKYREGSLTERMMLEIPASYYSVKDLDQLENGNKPFIIPDLAYDSEFGLEMQKIKTEKLNVKHFFL